MRPPGDIIAETRSVFGRVALYEVALETLPGVGLSELALGPLAHLFDRARWASCSGSRAQGVAVRLVIAPEDIDQVRALLDAADRASLATLTFLMVADAEASGIAPIL